MTKLKPTNFDEYISSFPAATQAVLEQIRAAIHQWEPQATEQISYDMPSFVWEGQYLIHFGAYAKHIGFYPAPVGDAAFETEKAAYSAGKSTIKIPLQQPLPLDFIQKMVAFRKQQLIEKLSQRK